MTSLRKEIDTANQRAAELEEKANTLETQHANKDDEFTSLQERAKLLEEQLEQAEIDLKESSGK